MAPLQRNGLFFCVTHADKSHAVFHASLPFACDSVTKDSPSQKRLRRTAAQRFGSRRQGLFMKKTALLAAAAALATASPALAHGYVGLEYGAGNIDGGGPDTDTDGWQ